jgi:hypothetical protein
VSACLLARLQPDRDGCLQVQGAAARRSRSHNRRFVGGHPTGRRRGHTNRMPKLLLRRGTRCNLSGKCSSSRHVQLWVKHPHDCSPTSRRQSRLARNLKRLHVRLQLSRRSIPISLKAVCWNFSRSGALYIEHNKREVGMRVDDGKAKSSECYYSISHHLGNVDSALTMVLSFTIDSAISDSGY